jgi:hypothetical protein
MVRNECDLRNNCDNWYYKCVECDGKLYWREPVKNTFEKLFNMVEKKDREVSKKINQLSEVGLTHNAKHFSIGDSNYFGPSRCNFKLAKQRQIERETIEKMLDLQWKRYCEMKGGSE